MPETPPDDLSSAIAIIGMSGRFPGADDVAAFWRNLREGVESIRFFSDAELLADGVAPDLLAQPGYVKAGAVLAGCEDFAAGFFGIGAAEAQITDPQHRVFLECAWQALEDAGYVGDHFGGRIAVYAGAGLNTYLLENLLPNAALLQTLGILPLLIGNKADFLASSVSYKLGLRGESVNVGSACSTSLVAVHLACRSLLAYECDMALAGGVAIAAAQRRGYFYQSGGVYSPDGHCRAFDARAMGTVGGNGAGVVLLKRLDEALADGDAVVAVIRGSAINNDGAAKVGFTAPSVAGQREVIAQALALAEVPAHSIGYVETHGTGTTVGDPIELRALAEAFGPQAGAAGSCAIGSLKPNVGHLDAAAGVASLIKAALCLQQRTLVPSLHCEQPNPAINFAATPFEVNTTLRPWLPQAPGLPLRAAVSAFGIGGTNAHAVLQEAPPPLPRAAEHPDRRWQLLPLSARSVPALQQATARLATHLQQQPTLALADAAYTLQVGRKAFAQRRMLLARDGAEATTLLASADGECGPTPARLQATAAGAAPSLVMMFPGIGDHYPGMGWPLYQEEPVLREQLDHCAALLLPRLGIDIRDLLFPQRHDPGFDAAVAAAAEAAASAPRRLLRRPGPDGADQPALQPAHRASLDAAQAALGRTEHLHPALFALEYALARLCMHWVGPPAALIGYSLGEYTAACVAGVMSLEDALMLVSERARLIQQQPAGRMLAVALPEATLRALLPPGVALAAVNGPAMCVAAGEPAALAALEQQLAAQGIAHLPVASGHAFHSPMLAAIQAPLQALLAGVVLRPPTIPYISNRSGGWASAAEATDPALWARHTLETVRFADGLATLASEPRRIYLEVGPGQTLCSLLQQCSSAPPAGPAPRAQPCLPAAQEAGAAAQTLARALGWLWCQGLAVDWPRYHAGRPRRRVPLPTYPFERQRHWIARPGADLAAAAAVGAVGAAAGTAPPHPGDAAPGARLYRPGWTAWPLPAQPWAPAASAASAAAPAAASAAAAQPPWLLFEADEPVSRALLQQLAAAGQAVLRVRPGGAFRQAGSHAYALNPDRADDLAALVQALRAADQWPQQVIHGWALDPLIGAAQAVASTQQLWAALGPAGGGPLPLAVLAQGTQAVAGDEALQPLLAPQLAACRVGALEFPQLAGCHIDLLPPCSEAEAQRIAAQVLQLLRDGLSEPAELALRGARCWQRGQVAVDRRFERAQAPAAPPTTPGGASPGASADNAQAWLVHGYTGRGRSALAAELALAQGATRLILAAAPILVAALEGGCGAGPAQGAIDAASDAAAKPSRRPTDLPDGDADGALQAARQHLQRLQQPGLRVQLLALPPDAGLPVALATALPPGIPLHGACILLPEPAWCLLQQGAASAPPLLPGLPQLIDTLQAAGARQVALLGSTVGLLGGVGRLAEAGTQAWAQALAQAQPWAAAAAAPLRLQHLAFELLDDSPDAAGHSGLPPGVAEALAEARRPAALSRADALPLLQQALASAEPALLLCAGDIAPVLRGLQAATLPQLGHLARLAALQAGRPGAVGSALGSPPAEEALASRAAFEAPDGDFEAALATIWSELFRDPHIGAHDNFFALGGNSLLAVQFFTRLRQRYQVELPLRALFQSPTLRGMAGALEQALLAELAQLSDDEVQQQMGSAATATAHAEPAAEPAPLQVAPSRCTLPNGLSVRHFNPVETDHFYHDIFVSRVYHRHGITLHDGAVVFDIGANIGLFSLYVAGQCRAPRLHAFEPAPPVFQLLQHNLRSNGVEAQLFNCGVADRLRTQQLTFYPLSTGMSSFHADVQQEKEVLHAIMQNQQRDGMPGMGEVMDWADQILEQRFQGQGFDCPMLTISEVMRRQQLPQIDLMKIDVQKSELEVLQGIDDAHWPLIRQIVIEVHDLDGRVAEVSALLRQRGYSVMVEQELLYESSNISNLYALRR